ncbi:hypothetical protein D9757_002264 [Collybiopsis confluens]|uniref:Extracellular membrane protein CFEM domain-containing protein n=1 Tax=Collybiopsis confluens TaxID=2823264 RepID=A0A8H5HZV2_9AGAR|nr:hypothetical protein D9757_002264 [Collybiopsis confluens]
MANFNPIVLITVFLLSILFLGKASKLPEISARQSKPSVPSSQVPTNCNKQCTILTTLENCDTEQCYCTNSNAQGFASCLDCLVAAGSGTVQDGQTLMDDFSAGCADGGFAVKSQTIKASGARSLQISITALVATAAFTSTLLA